MWHFINDNLRNHINRGRHSTHNPQVSNQWTHFEPYPCPPPLSINPYIRISSYPHQYYDFISFSSLKIRIFIIYILTPFIFFVNQGLIICKEVNKQRECYRNGYGCKVITWVGITINKLISDLNNSTLSLIFQSLHSTPLSFDQSSLSENYLSTHETMN